MAPLRTTKLDDRLHWYKDAIIYELHIKAFRDSNGDGIGDFEGLMQSLDYLQWLGVTAIWVLPFYPSPLKDDGYDIADYYSINPRYGDLQQFKAFLDEAHRRGLRVITELVINHTSDQHPWFQRARLAPKGSPERDFYVWTDNPNQYKDVRIIFQDFETSNWTWDPVAQQYYWHRFFHHQPDLNYDNPQVQEEVFRVLDYWCEMGVDGFRLDAVPYLFEREGTNGENLPETHAFLKKLRAHVDENYPGTLLLAEANMWPEDSASYFGDGDECQMNYHFPVMPRLFMSLQMEDRYPIIDIFEQTPDIPETCQWAIFLRNHDELTLEMVTDEERDYMYKVYVKDPKARINLGIRHRLAPLMEGNRAKIELLNYLLFSLPGTPVVYYGDEIGMGDNFYLGDRDGVRTPMQWTGERNAGFSAANPQQLYLPLIIDPLYHYESVNVELQSHNTSSLLWWTKRMIQIRKRSKAFSRGNMQFIASENSKVLSFTRTYEGETVLVVANLSRYTQPVTLDLSAFGGYKPVEIFSKNGFPAIEEGKDYFLTLAPYACQWFMLEQQATHPAEVRGVPSVHLNDDSDTLPEQTRRTLEELVLPQYLQQMRWFGGKARKMDAVSIAETATIPVGSSDVWLMLLEVTYAEGLQEFYQLPVAFMAGEEAEKQRQGCPLSVICSATMGGVEGILYDALFGESLQQAILGNMAAGTAIKSGRTTLKFSGNRALKEYTERGNAIASRVLSAEQSNTSIVYDKTYFLKIYRKVDRVTNPDLEITRFLTEEAQFEHVPAFVGAIEWVHGKDTMVLGMMQEMVDATSDGWTFMLDRLQSFYETVQTSGRTNFQDETEGSLLQPLDFEQVPDEMRALLDGAAAERTRLLGERTGELHLALAGGKTTDFRPEDYSLHYQRSLFSSFQTLVRTAFTALQRKLNTLPDAVRADAEEVLGMRQDILKALKRIYRRKIDTVKIRVHGDYHLGQVLFTGKDVVILDFEGEPSRSYSERRLKRSPIRDVAGMIRSYHYAAYGSLFLDDELTKEEREQLMPYAEQWYHYMSGFFMRSYLQTVENSPFLPSEEEDLKVLLETFLLEKVIYELNYELNNRPDWVIIPLRGIRRVMEDVGRKAVASS
jgi:maltose alpha-D-glucosyltransferase/alpha-amylase